MATNIVFSFAGRRFFRNVVRARLTIADFCFVAIKASLCVQTEHHSPPYKMSRASFPRRLIIADKRHFI